MVWTWGKTGSNSIRDASKKIRDRTDIITKSAVLLECPKVVKNDKKQK
jgi:hypothetical protein